MAGHVIATRIPSMAECVVMQPLFCGNWGSTDASQSSPIFLRYLLGQADPSDFDRPSLLYGLFDFRQPFDQAAIECPFGVTLLVESIKVIKSA